MKARPPNFLWTGGEERKGDGRTRTGPGPQTCWARTAPAAIHSLVSCNCLSIGFPTWTLLTAGNNLYINIQKCMYISNSFFSSNCVISTDLFSFYLFPFVFTLKILLTLVIFKLRLDYWMNNKSIVKRYGTSIKSWNFHEWNASHMVKIYPAQYQSARTDNESHWNRLTTCISACITRYAFGPLSAKGATVHI